MKMRQTSVHSEVQSDNSVWRQRNSLHWTGGGVLFFLLIFGAWMPSAIAKELRIAIQKGVGQITVGSSTPATVKDGSGRSLGELTEMAPSDARATGKTVTLGQFSGNQLLIEPAANGYVWIGDRWFRGRTRLILVGSKLVALNLIDLENYLYSVVGAEAIPTWPLEALKAQAVAARTYAIYKTNTASNRYYDLDTSTQTQVYKGLNTEFLSTQDAVNSTAGQILTYGGKAILAAFHSSSGGHTENVEDVWSSSLPYLRGVVDYDQQAPVFQWSKDFSRDQLTRSIGGIGTVRSLIPERTSPQGRVLSMRIVGSAGSKILSGSQIREALDLRSTLFTVSLDQGQFEINGRGYGHGIGLSQWGTYYLASQGISYDQILGHYYQNAQLSTLP